MFHCYLLNENLKNDEDFLIFFGNDKFSEDWFFFINTTLLPINEESLKDNNKNFLLMLFRMVFIFSNSFFSLTFVTDIILQFK